MVQAALEVWDYSQHHLSQYAASAEYSSRSISFRHVPFAFFDVVWNVNAMAHARLFLIFTCKEN